MNVKERGKTMKLVPWKRTESERPLLALQREMNSLFDDFFGRDLLPEPFRGMGGWRPALDLSETENAVVVKVELPGIEPKQVDVSLVGNVLRVSGEKKAEKEEKTRSFHRVERSYGAFERSVALPCDVNADKVDARFKDGVLTVELPKVAEAKGRSFKVKVEK